MIKKIHIGWLVLFILLITSSSCLAYSNRSIFRLRNPSTNEHLYTDDVNERRVLSLNGWIYEGVGWMGDMGGDGVYRLFNPNTGFHLYTMDTNEVQILQSQGWSVDNNGQGVFVSSGPVKIYRLYDPVSHQHLLTTDLDEYNVLGTQGWNQEGVAMEADVVGNTNPISLNLSVASGNPDISLSNRTYQIYVQDSKGYYNILFGEFSTGNSNTLTFPFIGYEDEPYMIQMKDQYPYYIGDFNITYSDYSSFNPITKNVPLQFFYGD